MQTIEGLSENGVVYRAILKFEDIDPSDVPADYENIAQKIMSREDSKAIWRAIKSNLKKNINVVVLDENERRGRSVAAGISDGLRLKSEEIAPEGTDVNEYVRKMTKRGKGWVI